MSPSLLQSELDHLDADTQKSLRERGFDADLLLRLAQDVLGADPTTAASRNRVQGPVLPPTGDELAPLPAADSPTYRDRATTGRNLAQRGGLAFCVMAGGMATRMGGVVKALVEVVDGQTFLDLRLKENARLSARLGRPIPLWLMTSDATEGPIREALQKRGAPDHVRTFVQNVSLRLSPEGTLFRLGDGSPSAYAMGHGDLVDSLRRSGLLASFRRNGGEAVWIANIDNLGATFDEAILGTFAESGKDVLVEVVDKAPGDKGGIPVHAQGRFQVLEEFRLPEGFDASKVPVFNTNTFLVRAEPLETAKVAWSYFRVEKTVEGRKAIQFERLLQELTATLPSMYLKVPREGAPSRFLPVKDFDELNRRRQTIETVLRSRGIHDAPTDLSPHPPRPQP